MQENKINSTINKEESTKTTNAFNTNNTLIPVPSNPESKISNSSTEEILDTYKNRIKLLESQLDQKNKIIRKLEHTNKKYQENLINNQKKNRNNTSVSFFLPSEFKNLWEKLIKADLLDAFDFYIDNYLFISNISQDSFIIIYKETENLIYKKMETMLHSLNIKSINIKNKKIYDKLISIFLPFLQENLFEIFTVDDEFVNNVKNQILEISKNYKFNYDKDNLENELNKNQFKKFVSSFFQICLYMLLHDPILTINIKPYANRKCSYYFYNKKDFVVIEGFAKDNIPCILILPPPLLRKKYPFNGMKPVVFTINDNITKDIINECNNNMNNNSLIMSKCSNLSNSLYSKISEITITNSIVSTNKAKNSNVNLGVNINAYNTKVSNIGNIGNFNINNNCEVKNNPSRFKIEISEGNNSITNEKYGKESNALSIKQINSCSNNDTLNDKEKLNINLNNVNNTNANKINNYLKDTNTNSLLNNNTTKCNVAININNYKNYFNQITYNNSNTSKNPLSNNTINLINNEKILEVDNSSSTNNPSSQKFKNSPTKLCSSNQDNNTIEHNDVETKCLKEKIKNDLCIKLKKTKIASLSKNLHKNSYSINQINLKDLYPTMFNNSKKCTSKISNINNNISNSNNLLNYNISQNQISQCVKSTNNNQNEPTQTLISKYRRNVIDNISNNINNMNNNIYFKSSDFTDFVNTERKINHKRKQAPKSTIYKSLTNNCECDTIKNHNTINNNTINNMIINYKNNIKAKNVNSTNNLQFTKIDTSIFNRKNNTISANSLNNININNSKIVNNYKNTGVGFDNSFKTLKTNNNSIYKIPKFNMIRNKNFDERSLSKEKGLTFNYENFENENENYEMINNDTKFDAFNTISRDYPISYNNGGQSGRINGNYNKTLNINLGQQKKKIFKNSSVNDYIFNKEILASVNLFDKSVRENNNSNYNSNNINMQTLNISLGSKQDKHKSKDKDKSRSKNKSSRSKNYNDYFSNTPCKYNSSFVNINKNSIINNNNYYSNNNVGSNLYYNLNQNINNSKCDSKNKSNFSVKNNKSEVNGCNQGGRKTIVGDKGLSLKINKKLLCQNRKNNSNDNGDGGGRRRGGRDISNNSKVINGKKTKGDKKEQKEKNRHKECCSNKEKEVHGKIKKIN